MNTSGKIFLLKCIISQKQKTGCIKLFIKFSAIYVENILINEAYGSYPCRQLRRCRKKAAAEKQRRRNHVFKQALSAALQFFRPLRRSGRKVFRARHSLPSAACSSSTAGFWLMKQAYPRRPLRRHEKKAASGQQPGRSCLCYFSGVLCAADSSGLFGIPLKNSDNLTDIHSVRLIAGCVEIVGNGLRDFFFVEGLLEQFAHSKVKGPLFP